jgi:Zn-dependent protease
MNLILALVGTAILAATVEAKTGVGAFIAANALNFVAINIFLAIFNLLPVPPFDGGHVVEGLLPPGPAQSFRKLGRYSLLVLVLLLLVLPTLSPRANVVARIVSPIVDQVTRIILAIFGLQLK